MKPARHAKPPLTRQYRETMAFMRGVYTRDTALTPEEREAAVKKALGE